MPELPPILQGEDKEAVQERCAELLRKMGLAGKENAYPCQLSGGQQQRAAIARALATDPAVILADEPTGNLDTATSVEIMRIFADLHERGKTIVMVTHEPDIAEWAEHRLVLRDGRILEMD